MRELYGKNTDFKQYVDRYCIKHKIDQEAAFCHSMVKCAAEYYQHVNDGKISVTKIDAGCGAAVGGDCK